MSLINERHIDTQRAGDAQGPGNFPSLMDFMNRREVKLNDFNINVISVTGQQQVHVLPADFAGKIAIGTTSAQTNGGQQAASLSTSATATPATTTIADSLGNITNLVEVRDATTHDPILNLTGRKIYGLLQADVNANDGDDIAPLNGQPSNLQVSFVVIDADGTMTLEHVFGDIHLALPRLFALRHIPEYVKCGSNADTDVIQQRSATYSLIRYYDVTTSINANTVIDLNGIDVSNGTIYTDVSGSSLTSIGSSSAAFEFNTDLFVRINGTVLRKGTDVVQQSSTTFSFNVMLDPGDSFQIEVPSDI